jgi:hypothetical protein
MVLHIEDDVGAGLGAADEHLPIGRGFQRGGGVGDAAGQQRRDAGVADAGPAAPPGGDVAGIGEVEHATPDAERRGDAAAGEGDLGPLSLFLSGEPVRCPPRRGLSGQRSATSMRSVTPVRKVLVCPAHGCGGRGYS